MMMLKNKKLMIPSFIVVCVFGITGIMILLISNNKQEIIDNNKEKQFKARIIEVYSNENIIVEPNENEDERKSSDKISVTGYSDIQLEIGMQVVITYNEEIMLSYPAKIIATNIQIDSNIVEDTDVFFATIENINEYNGTTIVLVNGLDSNDVNHKGKFDFSINSDVKLLWKGTEIKISDLKEGQSVSITSVGRILEKYPGRLTKVTKVILVDDEL